MNHVAKTLIVLKALFNHIPIQVGQLEYVLKEIPTSGFPQFGILVRSEQEEWMEYNWSMNWLVNFSDKLPETTLQELASQVA